MTVEQIEWFWECGCNVAEIAAFFGMPESEIKRIVWHLIQCDRRAA